MNMGTEWAKDVLRRAFSRLREEERKRLREHAEAGTKILCGKRANEWCEVDGDNNKMLAG